MDGPAFTSQSTAGHFPVLEQIVRSTPEEGAALLAAHLRDWLIGTLRLPPEALTPDKLLDEISLSLSRPFALYVALRLVIDKTLGMKFYEGEMRGATLTTLARVFVDEITIPMPAPEAGDDPYAGGSWPWPAAPPVDRDDRLPGIVFILATGRTGSTLLRTMLAGHPDLFVPPELNLLPFARMGERKRQVDHLGCTWMRSGLGSAFAGLEALTPDMIEARLYELEEQDVPVHEVYRRLQAAAGKRLLVDKSPAYTRHPLWLARGEEMFESPRYIFLTRHPYSVMESSVRMRFHRLRGDVWLTHDEHPWVTAEKTWATDNEHVLRFLESIPAERWMGVRYEDLVAAPENVMRGVCTFLEIEFDPALVTPYAGERMTRMPGVSVLPDVGDPNLLERSEIDSSLGEKWRTIRPPQRLSSFTRRVAAELGYELP